MSKTSGKGVRAAMRWSPLILCAAAVAVGLQALSELNRSDAPYSHFVPLGLVGAVVCGVIGIVLCVAVRLQLAARRRAQDGFRRSEAARVSLAHRTRQLEQHLEVLSASREVSLVLNQDVDFETILEKVLRYTAELSGERNRARIVLYTTEGNGTRRLSQGKERRGRAAPRQARRRTSAPRVEARALWEKGQVFFGKEARKREPARQKIGEVLQHGQLVRVAESDRLSLAFPLVADRELLGALQLSVPMEGEAAEHARHAEEMERRLCDFMKMVALAVKTPDLYSRTIHDGLTGLYSKRHFLTQLEHHFALARRHGDALALMMIDIDHFKKVNDTHGHQTGDLVLREVARIVQRGIRAYASAYRYGGEELAVLLPKATPQEAARVGERIRKRVAQRTFKNTQGQQFSMTLSAGLASYRPRLRRPQELIEAADRALYRAKREGRDRIVSAPAP